MKHHRSITGLLALALAALLPALASAQTTELPASVFGSGGGTATSTDYSLTGTIGQPAVENVTGTGFDHDAGFWPAANALTEAALAGTFTIGGISPSYATFQDAADDLEAFGVEGPVVFNVRDGTYTEQLWLSFIDGASPTNTVTFQSESGDSTLVTLQWDAAGPADNWVVKLDTVRHVIFQKMTFLALGITSATNSHVFHIISSDSIAIKNNILAGASSSSKAAAVVYTEDSAGDDWLISGNDFQGGSYGIYFEGLIGGLSSGTRITGNTFSDQRNDVIALWHQLAPAVTGNTITSTTTFIDAIYLNGCDGALSVLKNRITIPSGNGIYILNSDGFVGSEGLVANNSVHMGNNASVTAYGIQLAASNRQQIYHNSINITSTSTGGGRALFTTGSGGNLEVVNNILANSGGGYAYYVGDPTDLTASDYNDLYSPGNYIASWGGADLADVAALRGASIYDDNSVEIYPNFASDTDLRPNSLPLDNKGTDLTAIVADDIDGNPRTAPTDIGAYEFSNTGTALAGSYSIEPDGSGNYITFAEAIADLNKLGISGSVIFNVADGTYVEQLSLFSVAGADASYSITFQSGALNPTLVTLTAAGTSADNYVVQFAGVDHVILQYLTVTNSSSIYGRVLVLTGDSDFITLRGNILTSTINTLIRSYQSYGSDRVFTENTLISSDYGITVDGQSSRLAPAPQITDNILTNQDVLGVFLQYVNAPTVSGNTISSSDASITGIELQNVDDPVVSTNTITLTSSSGEGIYLNSCDGSLVIQRNRVTMGSGYGIRVGNSDGIPIVGRGLIANNAVRVGGLSTANGIELSNSTVQDILHNTVNITSTHATSGRALYVISGGNDLNLQNNIFINTGGGYAYYVSTTAAIATSNYNDLYTTGATLARWGSTDYATFADLRAASGKDGNSINADPLFVDAANDDYHLSSGSPALGAGDSISVTIVGATDISGVDPRPNPPGTRPDLGAYESPFDAPQDVVAPAPVGGLTATAQDTAVGLSWNANTGDADLASYRVYRHTEDDSTVAGAIVTLDKPTTTYTDTDIIPTWQRYYYWVSARDSAGNESVRSVGASAVPDITPPPAPTGLTAEAGDTQVDLSWNAGVADVAAYNVFRHTAPVVQDAQPVATVFVPAISHTDSNLTNGTTYFYWVNAEDSAGNVSDLGNFVTAIPEPPMVVANTGSGWFNEFERIRVLDSTPVQADSANPAALQLVGTPMTLEAWVLPFYFPAEDDTMMIAARINSDETSAYALRLVNPAGGPGPVAEFAIREAGGTEAAVSTPIPRRLWTHLAGTYDYLKLRLYTDGMAQDSFVTSLGVAAGDAGFYIGGAEVDWFAGFIDEVRLWGAARTQQNILTNMNTALLGSETDLRGYWPLNDTSTVHTGFANPVTEDFTFNNNHLFVESGGSFFQATPFGPDLQPEFLTDGLRAVVGEAFTYRPVWGGGPGTTISLFSGPADMTYDDVNSLINWTPAPGQEGYRNFTLQATNSVATETGDYDMWVRAVRIASGDHDNNNVVLTVYNNGVLGSNDFGGSGQGFKYRGEDGLSEGDLIIARAPGQVSGGLYSREFAALSSVDAVASTLPDFDQAFEIQYNDSRSLNPIGLHVVQNSHSKSTAPDDDYVILDYSISNTSGVELTGIRVGLAMDWDVGDYVNNVGRYDTGRELLYVYDAGDPASKYFGTTVLRGNVSGQYVGPRDLDSDRELDSLASALGGDATVAADQRALLAVGPFNIPADGDIRVAFALLGGDDEVDLQDNADAAQAAFTLLPIVATGGATRVSDSSATLNALVNPNGSSATVIFQWGTTALDNQIDAGEVTGNAPVPVTAVLGSLTAGTSYQFRVEVTNADGTTTGGVVFFTTAGDENTTTDVVVVVGDGEVTFPGTSVTLGITFTGGGGADTIEVSQIVTTPTGAIPDTVNLLTNQYWEINHFGTGDIDTVEMTLVLGPPGTIGAEDQAMPSNIKLLRRADETVTDWTVIASAQSATDSSATFGGITGFSQFTVASAVAGSAPTAVTAAAADVAETVATLHGTVNPNGLSTVVEFEWGLLPTYGNVIAADPSPVSGSAEVAVSAGLTGLGSGTQYHYRVVATNGYGTRSGNDQTFTTLIVDTEAPSITAIAVSPTPPVTAGTAIDVTVTVTDNVGVNLVELHRTLGGASANSYVPITMNPGGAAGEYTASIPAGAVTLRGVVFFIRAVDTAPTANADSSALQYAGVGFQGGQLTTTITGSAFEAGFPRDQWRLISVPATPDNSSVGAILSPLGASTDTTWKIFKYTHNPASQWQSASTSTMARGASYWLYQQVQASVQFDAGAGRTDKLQSFAITLPAGPDWNLIANPYPFPVSIQLDQATYHGPLTYDGSSWTGIRGELAPWGGYIVYNRTPSSQTITVTSAPGGVASKALLAKTEEETPAGWLLNVQAVGRTYADRFNTLGRLEGASEALDRFDNPEPPYIDDYVSLAMERPDWGANLPRFTSDIRSSEELEGVWELALYVKGERGPITLSTLLEGDWPPQHRLVLIDLLTRQEHDLLADEALTITRYREDFPYHMKVVAGTSEYVSHTTTRILAELPTAFALAQNYPNPFNPNTTLRYSLIRPARLTLSVYDLLGREVVRLVDGWQDLGHHEAAWNGRDRSGSRVASGLYFAAYRVEGRIYTRKMVLMK